jgi:hypothetical protein
MRSNDPMLIVQQILSIAAQSCLLSAYSRKLLGVHAWEMTVDHNTESALVRTESKYLLEAATNRFPACDVHDTYIHPNDDSFEADNMLLLLPTFSVLVVPVLGLLYSIRLHDQFSRHLVQRSVCV